MHEREHLVTSFFGVNDTSTTMCPTQSRVFRCVCVRVCAHLLLLLSLIRVSE